MNHYLFVCSVNMLRSPTAEHVARLHGFLADSAGTDRYEAIRPLTVEAIERAEKIVCMQQKHADHVLRMCPSRAKDVEVWDIPDDYPYCDPILMQDIRRRLGVREK